MQRYPQGDTVHGQPASSDQTLTNIMTLLAYSFEDCMDACVQYNENRELIRSSTPCGAATYNASLTWTFLHTGSNAANCFLRNARGVGQQEPFTTYVNYGVVPSGYMMH